ncbi:MAG: hypothetical protein HN368_07855 [Spirochaetales bacterium]|jgi:hypothetical protein|nr:hypothetical protein [Spirochaetales bacterium]
MTNGWESREVPAAAADYRKAGYITVDKNVWNIFFMKSPAQRRDELLSDAENQAKEEFGNEALIANTRLSSQWSPYSLLLSLNMLGFVERGVLRADVLVPLPPPPPKPEPKPAPEPEPVRTVLISYPIEPRERFNDNWGYIGLEYLTQDEVKEKIKTRLDKREADPEDYQREYAKISEGGEVLIHIGRQDLMHANTLWYSYSVANGAKTLISRKGNEGIPNIKGRDGNWWNTLTVSLDQPIADYINVTVTDSKSEQTYEFKVIRTEQVM